MKVKLIVFLSLLLAGAVQAENVEFSGTLIQASPNDGPVDPRLAGIQKKLQKFPFKSFKLVGEGSGKVVVPGKIAFEVGGGNTVVANATGIAGSKVNASIQWQRGGKNVIDTTVGINKGSGTILGGPKANGGVLILYLTVE